MAKTLTQAQLTNKADDLAEIKLRIESLIDHAKEVLCGTGDVYERATDSWLHHFHSALHTGYDVSTGTMNSMQDTINELLARKGD